MPKLKCFDVIEELVGVKSLTVSMGGPSLVYHSDTIHYKPQKLLSGDAKNNRTTLMFI